MNISRLYFLYALYFFLLLLLLKEHLPFEWATAAINNIEGS